MGGGPDEGMDAQELGDAENFNAMANGGEIEVGFEEPNIEVHGFGSYNAEKQQKNLRDMFKVHSMKRFDAAGGGGQEIQLNQFAIRKQVDVKRLKKHLWETMEPQLHSLHEAADVEMKEEGANQEEMAEGGG